MADPDKDLRMNDVSDDDLIRMYREGDADAFDTLFDRYYTSVYNFALTMLGNMGSSEEVLQETFLAVARTAKTYTPRGRFRAWLMRIVRNRCLNRIESERVRRAVLVQSGLADIRPVANEPLPSENLEADEQAAIVHAAIAALSDRQREAMTLYAFERMSYGEIADVLETPINTVKTLIHRARASIARALESQESER